MSRRIVTALTQLISDARFSFGRGRRHNIPDTI